MTGTDKAIRWSTVGAVSVVALVAAFVSYRHALTVVRAHGEAGALALAYPLTIDGMIYASSMVLLNAARRGAERPWLAYAALGAGIAATLAANVAAGLAYGPVGALVAAWPAPALVISYELLMLVIRSSVRDGGQPAVPAALTNGHAAPEGGREAAEMYADDLAAGELPSVRQIRRQMHIGQPRAQQVRAYLGALSNGHSPSS